MLVSSSTFFGVGKRLIHYGYFGDGHFEIKYGRHPETKFVHSTGKGAFCNKCRKNDNACV